MTRSWLLQPVTWKSGTLTSVESSAPSDRSTPMTRIAVSVFARKFACVVIAPVKRSAVGDETSLSKGLPPSPLFVPALVRVSEDSSVVVAGATLPITARVIDRHGNPVKDANGRFIKTSNIVGYTVMEKRAGWGAEYPEAQRNGEWEYQAFRADKTANPNANLTACFNCHKPQAGQDYVFSYQSMKTTTR